MHEVIPGARVEGKILIDGSDLYDADVDPVEVRRQIGMVVSTTQPVPDDVHRRERPGRDSPQQPEDEEEQRRTDVVERSLQRANLWNEVKDRLEQARLEPVRWTAAAACALHGRSPCSRRSC